MSTRSELLRRAAHCYLVARWDDDACRCLEDAADHAAAARLHEQARRWGPAARHYALAQDWPGAARCHLKLGRPEEAAEALVRAGDSLRAAWVLAEHAGHYTRALATLVGVAAERPADRLAHDLVVVRCEAGRGEPASAAHRLAGAVEGLRSLGHGFDRERVEEWAFAVGRVLRRFDLIALIHAAAVTARVPGAPRRWEEWATATLGDATGVPREDDLSSPANAGHPGTGEHREPSAAAADPAAGSIELR